MTKAIKKDFLQMAFNLEDFQDMEKHKIWRLINLFLSEFFATAVTVYLGCSTIQATLFNQTQDNLTIAIVFSFAVGTSIFIFGHISGSHINPCISLTSVIMGEMSIFLALFYSLAQCLGSTFGYALTRAILPAKSNHTNSTVLPFDTTYYANRCCAVPNTESNIFETLLTEICGTGILIWAVCSSIDKRNKDFHHSMPVKFGMILIAIGVPTALYSGCSLNPAKSFGPAFYNGLWEYQWLYWVGPFTGAIITATLYRIVFDPSHMQITPELR